MYTPEFNTYDVREEFLYPIEMNDTSYGEPQPDANLASYLITLTEFKKTDVKIEKKRSKVRFFK